MLRIRSALLVVCATVPCTSSAALAASLPGTATSADRAAWQAIIHRPSACEVDGQVAHPILPRSLFS